MTKQRLDVIIDRMLKADNRITAFPIWNVYMKTNGKLLSQHFSEESATKWINKQFYGETKNSVNIRIESAKGELAEVIHLLAKQYKTKETEKQFNNAFSYNLLNN